MQTPTFGVVRRRDWLPDPSVSFRILTYPSGSFGTLPDAYVSFRMAVPWHRLRKMCKTLRIAYGNLTDPSGCAGFKQFSQRHVLTSLQMEGGGLTDRDEGVTGRPDRDVTVGFQNKAEKNASKLSKIAKNTLKRVKIAKVA